MKRRQFITAVGGATLLAGCSSSTDDSSDEGPLVVLSHRLEMFEYGGAAVVGRAENVSDDVISYAQIHVSFYDGNTRIGTGLANISDLRPGRVWEFEALYPGTDAERITEYGATVEP